MANALNLNRFINYEYTVFCAKCQEVIIDRSEDREDHASECGKLTRAIAFANVWTRDADGAVFNLQDFIMTRCRLDWTPEEVCRDALTRMGRKCADFRFTAEVLS